MVLQFDIVMSSFKNKKTSNTTYVFGGFNVCTSQHKDNRYEYDLVIFKLIDNYTERVVTSI